MKLILVSILASLALFVSAVAQTAPTATLSWGAVTAYTDGTAIPASCPVTYNVYQGPTASTMVKVASGVTTLTSSITTGLVDGNTYFFGVTAVACAVEGAQSNAASKVFAAGTPGVVTLTVK